ncbi:MAG: L-2-hydroxyglutarate oxidase, partial [Saprospiraceae bacterium]|nr:L-2-hydroxyglutarate oxidase [Saprospiraceae bacterium]
EKEPEVAMHQSGHNSGVIHSGIYYKPGSLRAENCRQGYALLLEFCDQHHIPYELCGKLIVATSTDELASLQQIYQRGLKNGLRGLALLDANAAHEIEPHIRCVQAIRVPQSGIINFREVALTLAKLFEGSGGKLFCNEQVRTIEKASEGVVVSCTNQVVKTKYVVSCAGLYADVLAGLTSPEIPYQIIPFRGEYFDLSDDRTYLVNNLIYPVPNPDFPFLGVHFTRMIRGGIEAGPNAVLAFRREGYRFSDFQIGEFVSTLQFPGFRKIASKYWRTGLGEMRRSVSKRHFVQALKKLIPDITTGDVNRGGAGVRAMACDRAGNLLDDFLILEDQKVIHMINAPSPAATASLAIGRELATRVMKKYN